MSQRQDDVTTQRSRIALVSIHEARQVADNAVDNLISEMHQNGPDSDYYQDAAQDAHAAVMMLYNRLRPYLMQSPEYWTQKQIYVERDEHGDPITTEEGREKGMYGLASLDQFRLATETVTNPVERVGAPDEEEKETVPLKLPPQVAVAAYDALNEAIVTLGFGAEVAGDVDEADLESQNEDEETAKPPFGDN